MKKLFVVVLCFFGLQQIQAHALWIEANASGKQGEAQQVKIFYGEYAEFSPEKVKDWYSDVTGFTLWLVTPDNQKSKIEVTPQDDHYTASFTPDSEGQYTLLVSHNAKDLGGTTLYQFNSSAIVNVGKQTAAARLESNSNPVKFLVVGDRQKKQVAIQGFFKDIPADKLNVTIFSPVGWTKELKIGADGKVAFFPEWKGKYMIEVSRVDEEKGEHNGKEYAKVWRCATYLIDVK